MLACLSRCFVVCFGAKHYADCLEPSELFVLMRENALFLLIVVVFILLEAAHSHVVSSAVDKTDHLLVD
jgi:hypothetical protein